MIILAVIGVIINGLATLRTSHTHNLNEKSISLHLLEDVLGWVSVLVGSIIIKFTGWYIIDPILSILITIFILVNVYKNIKQITNIFLEKKPEDIDIENIKELLSNIKFVKNIHHIHIWSMDNINNYMTMHILVDSNSSQIEVENLKHEIREILEQNNINHCTIETEYEYCNNKDCTIKQEIHEHKHE